jgi:hypothetical protein
MSGVRFSGHQQFAHVVTGLLAHHVGQGSIESTDDECLVYLHESPTQ